MNKKQAEYWYYRYGQVIVSCFLIVLDLTIASGMKSKSYFWQLVMIMLSVTIIYFGLNTDLKQAKRRQQLANLSSKVEIASPKKIILTIIIASIIMLTPTVLMMMTGHLKAQPMTVVNLLYTVVLAPMLEEIIFRQYLFDSLRRFGSLLAFIVVCLLFTLIHFPSTIGMMVYLLLRAAILMMVYLICNQRVFASWSVHFANNLLLVLYCVINAGISLTF